MGEGLGKDCDRRLGETFPCFDCCELYTDDAVWSGMMVWVDDTVSLFSPFVISCLARRGEREWAGTREGKGKGRRLFPLESPTRATRLDVSCQIDVASRDATPRYRSISFDSLVLCRSLDRYCIPPQQPYYIMYSIIRKTNLIDTIGISQITNHKKKTIQTIAPLKLPTPPQNSPPIPYDYY